MGTYIKVSAERFHASRVANGRKGGLKTSPRKKITSARNLKKAVAAIKAGKRRARQRSFPGFRSWGKQDGPSD